MRRWTDLRSCERTRYACVRDGGPLANGSTCARHAGAACSGASMAASTSSTPASHASRGASATRIAADAEQSPRHVQGCPPECWSAGCSEAPCASPAAIAPWAACSACPAISCDPGAMSDVAADANVAASAALPATAMTAPSCIGHEWTNAGSLTRRTNQQAQIVASARRRGCRVITGNISGSRSRTEDRAAGRPAARVMRPGAPSIFSACSRCLRHDLRRAHRAHRDACLVGTP